MIESMGVEKLDLREVARRLGVSHQAPYRHFPSRDPLLAAVVARAFASFARHLDDERGRADAADELHAMGLAHLAVRT